MNRSPFDLTAQNNSIDDKIIAALERISQAFRVLLWNESKTLGLTPIQIQTLIFLRHHSADKRKISYLATELGVTKATVSETVKTLLDKKLVEKETEVADSRSFVIRLTAAGKKIAHQTQFFASAIATPIHQLESVDKDRLFKNLIGVIHHLNEAGIISVQRMCFSCVYYTNKAGRAPHFCRLMNTPLKTQELRIDCPEHQPAKP